MIHVHCFESEKKLGLLEKLRDSSLVMAWQISMRCRLLLSPKIGALLDPDVVDWNDFYLSKEKRFSLVP